MTTKEQIDLYISSQPESKRLDMEALHLMILRLLPGCKLWFLDGKNTEGKIVSNPSIGYGSYTMKYADGTKKPFYQIGMSAGTTGISIYILGIKNKKYLPETYGRTMGKATVSGYCIKFKNLKDIDTTVLQAAIHDGVKATHDT